MASEYAEQLWQLLLGALGGGNATNDGAYGVYWGMEATKNRIHTEPFGSTAERASA